LSGNVQWL